MIYRISHVTSYTYSATVPLSHSRLWMTPRTVGRQSCRTSELRIDPQPSFLHPSRDYFGNTAHNVGIESQHESLRISALSQVKLEPRALVIPVDTPPWEVVRDQLAACTPAARAAAEFCVTTPLTDFNAAIAAFARPFFTPGEPILEALMALNHALYSGFDYERGNTTVATRASEVLNLRTGVCQDFAHLMIAACRSVGLAARYVSGYLQTFPPPGLEKQPGSDESHAWLAVWCGAEAGWIDLDPTNDMAQPNRHITVAWGRDYDDVPPMKGIIHSAASQIMEVAVDIEPMEDEEL